MKRLATLFAILFASALLHAQVYEIPCPAGYDPVPQIGKSNNPQTGKFRAWLCIRQSDGDIVSPVFANGAAINNKPYADAVRDCHAVGDGVTNDGPVLQACIDANKGKTIYFPKTQPVGHLDYWIATAAGSSGADHFALIMNGGGQRLIGNTHGQAIGTTGNGVTIGFAAGLTGVLIPNSNAIAGVPITNIACQGCSVENLMLQGSEPYIPSDPRSVILPGVGDTSTSYGTSTGVSQADGIRCGGTYCTVRDVGIEHFGRHGIYLDGNSGGGYFADSSLINNVVLNFNRGSGIFNRGSDSNATSITGIKCTGNQLWCIENYSFLGSTFIGTTAHSQHVDLTAGHTTTYNIATITNAGGITTVTTTAAHNFVVGMAAVIAGTVNYNGTFFIASVGPANKFTYAQGSPIAGEVVGTATNATATQAWTKAGNDAIGGCFRSTGGAVTSVFVNPYCESDNNGTNQVNQLTNIIIGGDIGNSFDWLNNPPSWITTTSGGMTSTPVVFTGRDTVGNQSDVTTTVGGPLKATDSHNGAAINFLNNNAFAAPAGSKGHLEFRLSDTTTGAGVWGFRALSGVDSGGLQNYPLYMEYGASTGSANIRPKSGFPNGIMIGAVTAGSIAPIWIGQVTNTTQFPNWFTQIPGSFAYSAVPAAGGFGGWMAITSGAPGTYKAAMPIANDATGINWTLPQLNITQFADVTEIAAPAVPAVGSERWYADSSTHLQSCIRHDGTPCGSGAASGPIIVYITASGPTAASIGATSMIASATAPPAAYRFGGYVVQDAIGVTCSSNTNIVLTVRFTDPNAAGTQDFNVMSWQIPGNGTAGGIPNVLAASIPTSSYIFQAKATTAISYLATVSPDATCGTQPTYHVLPVLEQL